jgi:translation initiation factor IF-3
VWGTPRFCGGDCDIERDVRVNERIRAREVRLIDENGAQLGIVPTREALRIARERELDLIEVAPNAQPPVCRIMDYGKHKYQQAKRDREQHKRSKPTEVRLLRLKPQIGSHDLDIKVRKLRELLMDGNKVRIQLRFRGREISHPELGTKLLNKIASALAEDSVVEGSPRFEGRMMNMLLAPNPKAKPAAPSAPRAAAPEKHPQAAAPAAGETAQPAPTAVAPPAAAPPAVEAQPPAEARPASAPVAPRPEVAVAAPVAQERAATTGPVGPSKVDTDGKEQVQRPRAQNEDTEDSGEAG